MTAVANTALPAATWNIHVRDNLNETGPAKATTAGRLIVTTGVNSIAERAVTQAQVLTSETTTNTSNTDLTTPGPSVTAVTGTMALVWWGAQMSNNTAGSISLMDFAVSSASTRSASDDTALKYESSNNGDMIAMSKIHLLTGLTAGSNIFTAKYWVSANTGGWERRFLGVLAL